MTSRVAWAAVVFTCLCGAAGAQAPPPNLSKAQRELLQALVTAVDAAASQPPTTNINWQSHVMRASDGSHYVAFTIEPSQPTMLPATRAMLYVRLATASNSAEQTLAERSAIREWLAGSRTDPRLLPRRNIAIGDMPTFGAGSVAVRGTVPSSGANDLRLLSLEREREREAREEREKQRRAELEGRVAAARELLPFEDFDLAAQPSISDGHRAISRALTAGPGDYDLYVAWADLSAPKPATAIHVVRKSLRLPAARTEGLTSSDIILASNVATRQTPYSPTEQASHPYSIGLMEITPARSSRYSRDDRLAVAFQIINAASSEVGMPDIAVGFRIVRVNGEREAAVASLNPQYYNATTLPADFNIRMGHPLFAAVSAPLATLTRGDYRLKVVVNDRVAGTSTNADADFTIIATPATLLAEAPSLAPSFTRDPVFEPAALGALVDLLRPASPSPQLARALQVAASGKLADLLVEEPVPPSEIGTRTALTGLAYLSIGDPSSFAQFQRALQEGAPVGPTQFLLGCARALQSRDADAVAAWQAALSAGRAPSLTSLFLAEALMRRNDTQRVSEIVNTAGAASTPAWTRLAAALHIAARREAEAITLLDRHLAAHRDDLDAQWLLLHAMYSQFVKAGQPMTAATRDRFTAQVRAYVDAKGAHATLAEEWLKIISSASA